MSFGKPDFKLPQNVTWEPAATGVKVTTFGYRRCTVNGEEAYFHRWEDKSWVVAPSPMIGGHPGGVVRGTYAIVEMKDGTVMEVEPDKVRFTDTHEVFERRLMGIWKIKEEKDEAVLDGKIPW